MNHVDPSREHVLISGCSSGIGRACAIHLARIGFIVFAGVRNEADAPTAPNIRPIRLDITDANSIAAAAQQIRTNVGSNGLKGLFNNAGISVHGPIEMVPLADWRRQFEVNILGHIAMTQAMLPLLRDHVATHGRWSARIINNTSIAGRIAQPMLGPYCASKFAMEAISDTLRLELSLQGIRVCVIEPGAVQSKIWRKGQEQAIPQSWKLYERLVRGIVAFSIDAGKNAIPAERAAMVVAKCLQSPHPPTRTLIGTDARIAALAKSILPTRWLDAIMLRFINKAADKPQPSVSRTT